MTADRLAGAEERLVLPCATPTWACGSGDIQTDAVVVDTSWQRMLGLSEDEAGSDFTALFSRMNSEDVSTFREPLLAHLRGEKYSSKSLSVCAMVAIAGVGCIRGRAFEKDTDGRWSRMLGNLPGCDPGTH